ncbi:hypothetical protein OG698_17270 [Streptomyces sp. NBC_01003]|uniref:hypothetical protein n=1 Tax=Streptomyces sp. NBC_01003 TaxID=2903714 RepID=UPI00386BEB5D|nr:hypothetical protein OG698_17270 [Streptomyces sp. NBC_01003]
MNVVRQGAALLASVVITASATACTSSNEGLDVPGKFCGAPVKKSVLSPLLPEGKDLEAQQSGSEATEILCSLHVDGVQVLTSTIRTTDQPLPPEDWNTALAKYSKAKKREVSFAGAAVIGANGARATAKCQPDASSAFLIFNIDLQGDQIDNSQSGVKKLQGFLENYVPAMTKYLDCTT